MMTIIQRFLRALPAVALACAFGQPLMAQNHCDRCGNDCSSQKVCRLVCDEKELTVNCWAAECEEFCVHKWVLEELCSNCRAECRFTTLPEGTEVPEVPADAKADRVTVIPVRIEPAKTKTRATKQFADPH